jgi:hypothetical protein
MPATFGCCGDVIGGTPKRAGTYVFTIQVTDGVGDVTRQAFSIDVDPPLPLTITFPKTCCQNATIGRAYLQNFFLSGGVAPYSATISAGELPDELHLSSSPPISITGTPTTTGSFTFTVEATDRAGRQASESATIVVG